MEGANLVLAEEFDLWWTPQRLPQAGLAQSSVTLSQRFFEQLVEAPVPLDLRAIKALKRSPLSLDLYAWATRRVEAASRRLYSLCQLIRSLLSVPSVVSTTVPAVRGVLGCRVMTPRFK